VAIPCPRCGRGYDVTLFQFGRTIWCACGERVGLEPRVRELGAAGEIRFLADAMLGRLARWLRTIGCDTAFEPHIADAELARRALDEDRVVLTRDRAFPDEWRVPHVLLVESESALEQLRQVVRAYGLDPFARLFARCRRCNATLEPISAAAAGPRVPPRVRAEHDRFLLCPACDRIYWAGSHTDRMRRALEHALGAAGARGADGAPVARAPR
jgi:uncharacterized protein with PIN domain